MRRARRSCWDRCERPRGRRQGGLRAPRRSPARSRVAADSLPWPDNSALRSRSCPYLHWSAHAPPPHPRLDGLDRDPGARHRLTLGRARAGRALGAGLLARAGRAGARARGAAHRPVRRRRGRAGRRGMDRRRGARRSRGPRPPGRRLGRRSRPQRADRLGGPGPDGRRRSARASTWRWPTRSRWWSAASSSPQLAEATGAQIIPVDSEHSALHQLLAGERPGTVDRLVLTASRRTVPRADRARSWEE